MPAWYVALQLYGRVWSLSPSLLGCRCKAYQQGCEAGQCDEWLEEAWDSIGSSCYDLMSVSQESRGGLW